VVTMGLYTKLKHEAAEAQHTYIYLPVCSISTPCDADFCSEQTTRHDIDATAHRKPSRRSASMVRDAASRCNRITGKQSNIRQSSTTISHEPVASPLWPCGSERGVHANWPCLCHVVQLPIIAHGRAWLDLVGGYD
jgi:hypothetical protein